MLFVTRWARIAEPVAAVSPKRVTAVLALLFVAVPAYQSVDAVGPAVVEPALNAPAGAIAIRPDPAVAEFISITMSCVPFVPFHQEWFEPLVLGTSFVASKASGHKSVPVLTETLSHEATCVQILPAGRVPLWVPPRPVAFVSRALSAQKKDFPIKAAVDVSGKGTLACAW